MAVRQSHSLMQWPTYPLGQLHRQVHEAVGTNLRDHWILSVVAESGTGASLSQQDICDTLGIDRSEMVRLIDRLEESGLVERHRSTEDRRRYVVSITAAGREQVRRTDRLLSEATTAVFARLDEAELATLHRLAVKAIGGEQTDA